MKGLLNESTATVHKYEPQRGRGVAECGATTTVTHDQLRVLPVERALDERDASKCGRCFGDGGGY
ncbi:hypothetical protein ACAH01_03400 [Halomicrobium sp. HM KBTZ05]|uniref:hypothetical protein n=1 Tax=Halomicrobium sp. HM KBTZ05 TaxID=3242663 RepID=UPI0035589295